MIKSEDYYFPHPETSDKQGLLAIGGDLEPGRILKAYQLGIFPWYQPGCPVLWWSPNPRLLLRPLDFKISRSLQKSLKKPWQCTINKAFEKVITACATTSDRLDETWITSEMIEAYCNLHENGYAHSVEIWLDEQLVGGLYGIQLGRAFFGESMFHKKTDASKVALYKLCQLAINANFDFIDCQLANPHLQRLGAKLVSRKAFLYELSQTLNYTEPEGVFT